MTTSDVADPDRRLALLHAPADRQPGLAALFALDERLARIVAGTREPMLAAIRLAWWREALERLDAAPPPAEPLLQALGDAVVARGVGGGVLSRIVAGWEALPQAAATAEHGERGAALFEAAAGVLGGAASAGLTVAGKGWALVDLAFHDSDPVRGEEALAAARTAFDEALEVWPPRLRPLGMLAMLARGDAAAGLDAARQPGSPGRAARMIRFRLFGR